MAELARFTEAQRQLIRDSYVGNECGSDEYRETQPYKGLRHIQRAFEYLEDADSNEAWDQTQELAALTAKWLLEWTHGSEPYAGDKALEPVLTLVFDILWANGETPYGETDDELDELIQSS